MIHIFIGTKAQLVKMGPVMRSLQDQGIEYNFIYSGQHQSTFNRILDNFEIKKRADTTLYQGDDVTGIVQMGKWAYRIIKKYRSRDELNKLFKEDQNGIVLNHGDTFSTLLGSYLGKKQGLNCGHVESGLRSFNLFHPFPEEITRLLTFRLSNYFFAPGVWALENLQNHQGKKINTEHNTLLDALMLTKENDSATTGIPYALVSLHRFENIFSRKKLTHIVDLLCAEPISTKLIFILHKPTEKKLKEYKLLSKLERSSHIELHPRYDYFDFIDLLRGSEFLITDGGSNQEECYYLGKPCLLMRQATERKEGIGENAVLCYYEWQIFNKFLKNYKQYKTRRIVPKTSPTQIIIDTIWNLK